MGKAHYAGLRVVAEAFIYIRRKHNALPRTRRRDHYRIAVSVLKEAIDTVNRFALVGA
jgi:hypothetical protein